MVNNVCFPFSLLTDSIVKRLIIPPLRRIAYISSEPTATFANLITWLRKGGVLIVVGDSLGFSLNLINQLIDISWEYNGDFDIFHSSLLSEQAVVSPLAGFH